MPRLVSLRGSDRWYVVSALRKLRKIPDVTFITPIPPIMDVPFMQGSTSPRNTHWYVQQALDRVRFAIGEIPPQPPGPGPV